MIKFTYSLLIAGWLFCIHSENEVIHTNTIIENYKEASLDTNSLPMQQVPLDNLEAFITKGKNWQIVGGVYSDYSVVHSVELSSGSGILLNNQTKNERANIFTEFEHGDLELDIEFLMPKGSNSGLYFQSRYEIQLLDSHGEQKMEVKDCGSIYERWDPSRPEGQKGYEGHPPNVNACKAPGLWQHLRIFFRAPRFDANGTKIKNAFFQHVYLNGHLLHENVELFGTTRAAPVKVDDEVPFAPLMFQGDHGPVAFRNMKYKSYTQDSLTLENITYVLYEYPESTNGMPNDWSQLKLVRKGLTERLEIGSLNEDMEDFFALQFKAELKIEVSGKYLFNTFSRNGAELYIDGKRVIQNTGNQTIYGEIELSQGIHQVELNYFHKTWLQRLIVGYEGPGIYSRNFPNTIVYKPWEKDPEPYLLKTKEEPELLRGFVMKDGEKRTHCISVGEPTGWNYSYDLSQGALLRFWKGDFVNVTDMWHARGQAQLSAPLNASVEGIGDNMLNQLDNENSIWKEEGSEKFKYLGYKINKEGRPIFRYVLGKAEVEDLILPSAKGDALTRLFSIKNNSYSNLYLMIGKADYIEKLPTGLYSVGGKYYLEWPNIDLEPIIRKINGSDEMIIPLSEDRKIEYNLIW